MCACAHTSSEVAMAWPGWPSVDGPARYEERSGRHSGPRVHTADRRRASQGRRTAREAICSTGRLTTHLAHHSFHQTKTRTACRAGLDRLRPISLLPCRPMHRARRYAHRDCTVIRADPLAARAAGAASSLAAALRLVDELAVPAGEALSEPRKRADTGRPC
jgi:hypothetical protein